MKISVKNILAGIAIAAVIVLALFFSFHFVHKHNRISKGTIAAPAQQIQGLNPDTISIGFYNVENLFDLNYDGSEYPEYRPGALGWNQQTSDKKLANISSVIVALKVDIVGLCEIENRNALEVLREALKKKGAEFPFFAIADFSGKGSTCPSLLSKYPIVRSRDIRAPGEGMGGRSILEADVDCGAADTLKVFVNHWPSKAHPESERLVMAQALQARLRTLGAHCDYIIVGDLNTDYDEWSTFHAAGFDDTKGNVGLNHCLKTVHGGPPGKFQSYVTKDELCRPDSFGRHYDPWLEIPESKRFTRKYRNDLETPDHILLPPSLFDTAGLSYCNASFGPFTWNDTLLKDGEPYRWQMKGFGKRRFHTGEGYSDHLPLKVCLVKKPWVCDTTPVRESSKNGIVENNGFELSAEGWIGSSREIEVSRDSVMPFAGRYCLRLKGAPGKNNITACRTVLHRDSNSLSRSVRITFAIRGQGKISIRVRSLSGKHDGSHGRASGRVWQYYKGETFALCGSSRFLPVRFKSWRKTALAYTSGSAGVRDIEIEIRAGKESPFCFYLDDVKIQ